MFAVVVFAGLIYALLDLARAALVLSLDEQIFTGQPLFDFIETIVGFDYVAAVVLALTPPVSSRSSSPRTSPRRRSSSSSRRRWTGSTRHSSVIRSCRSSAISSRHWAASSRRARVSSASPLPSGASPPASPTDSPTFFVGGTRLQPMATVAALSSGGITRASPPAGPRELLLACSARPARSFEERQRGPEPLHSAVMLGAVLKVSLGKEGTNRAVDPFAFDTDAGFIAVAFDGAKVTQKEVDTILPPHIAAALAASEELY
ncbi:uncharacterized protein LOC62_02G002167 [Vanrija pseudolonga]|uniref:Uncharacterized protein n=1 Tax=Vanrija pseudolonga TaxID=143232 RepID=A0AAF0Y847_9TREE|nr:hypothetical protein LOC62_02G002167 [Vanrija pseudolonga]